VQATIIWETLTVPALYFIMVPVVERKNSNEESTPTFNFLVGLMVQSTRRCETEGGGGHLEGKDAVDRRKKSSWWVITTSSWNSFMPRELNDRFLMKTYYVVVEDVSFNARAVNLLFRNPLVLLYIIYIPSISCSDNMRA